MKAKIFLVGIFLLNTIAIWAQDNIVANTDVLYFGQTPPDSIPVIFASGIVSTNEFEFSGTFSKDRTEYFFTRRPTYEDNSNRIYYSQLIDNKWTTPILAPFAKNTFEFEPIASPFENKLYFYSERKENRDPNFDGDLWVTEKTASGWDEPTHFQSIVNKKWCMSVCPSLNGTLYFTSNYEGKRGIYKAENKKGMYPDIVYLDNEINSTFYSHPFIAPDESYMIMDAQPSGRGKPEIFISFKRKDGSWTTPKNLGPIINATKTEFGASVSPDGKYLFFHRRVNGQGDIYWVSTKIIEYLKPNNINK